MADIEEASRRVLPQKEEPNAQVRGLLNQQLCRPDLVNHCPTVLLEYPCSAPTRPLIEICPSPW
jgi:hypothetical protein